LVYYADFIAIAMQGSFSIYLKVTGLLNASANAQLGHICPSSMRIAKLSPLLPPLTFLKGSEIKIPSLTEAYTQNESF